MEIALQIVGWVAWAATVASALSFAYGCRTYAKRGIGFQQATALQTMLFWVAAIVFLLASVSKLHLLWILAVIYSGILPQLILIAPGTQFLLFVFMQIILVGIRMPNDMNYPRRM